MSTLRQAWKTMTEGTARTLKWVAGGMRGSSKKGGGDAKPESVPAANLAAASEKTWGERLEDRTGHSQRTIGLAIGVGIIALLWIGWTAYVWSENGSTAAIGVLISWPAALAAVMLVTAPFIGGAVAVRRHRAGEPVFAGAIAPAEASPSPAPEAKAEETKAEDADEDENEADESKDDSSEDDDSEEPDSEESS